MPLLGLAAPLFGFAALMTGGYSRFGLWRQMGIAVVGLIILQMVNTSAAGLALQDTRALPLVYAAPPRHRRGARAARLGAGAPKAPRCGGRA